MTSRRVRSTARVGPASPPPDKKRPSSSTRTPPVSHDDDYGQQTQPPTPLLPPPKIISFFVLINYLTIFFEISYLVFFALGQTRTWQLIQHFFGIAGVRISSQTFREKYASEYVSHGTSWYTAFSGAIWEGANAVPEPPFLTIHEQRRFDICLWHTTGIYVFEVILAYCGFSCLHRWQRHHILEHHGRGVLFVFAGFLLGGLERWRDVLTFLNFTALNEAVYVLQTLFDKNFPTSCSCLGWLRNYYAFMIICLLMIVEITSAIRVFSPRLYVMVSPAGGAPSKNGEEGNFASNLLINSLSLMEWGVSSVRSGLSGGEWGGVAEVCWAMANLLYDLFPLVAIYYHWTSVKAFTRKILRGNSRAAAASVVRKKEE